MVIIPFLTGLPKAEVMPLVMTERTAWYLILQETTPARIVGIAPTVLAMFGEDAPAGMDGNAMFDVISQVLRTRT